MSHRILRILYLVVPIALIVAFVFRPTPILGVEGESLASSAGVDVSLEVEPCSEGKREDTWTCPLPAVDGGEPTVISVEVDWKGCWTSKLVESGSVDPPSDGCVTLMDHLKAID